jgi:hypothetical protein
MEWNQLAQDRSHWPLHTDISWQDEILKASSYDSWPLSLFHNMLFLSMEWDCLWTAATRWPIVHRPDDMSMDIHGWMILIGKYIALYPRKLSSSYSPPREPEILPFQGSIAWKLSVKMNSIRLYDKIESKYGRIRSIGANHDCYT